MHASDCVYCLNARLHVVRLPNCERAEPKGFLALMALW